MQKLFAICLLLISVTCGAQFKADNVKYTTVFPEELCKALMANQDFTLLDVRSQGEVDDTSGSQGLNIGHLKNALHIDIRQMPQRWKELLKYKDKPLFIYCSHSQRSRRASRMLADSGFTKVFNINGGLTNFYDQGLPSNPCAGIELVTTVPYKIISARQLTLDAQSGKSWYIIDLRSDSVFNGLAGEKTKAEGRLEDARHIPFDQLMSGSDLKIPKQPILFVDEYGDESPEAAKFLIDKGYKDVGVLFDGMDGWVDYITNSNEKPSLKWARSIDYKMMPADEFNKMVKDQKQFSLIDVRSKEEFSNTSKNYWQNIGQIKGSTNIPSSELKTTTALPASKDAAVILYGFNAQPEIFESAKWLVDQGYKNVAILQGGIWGLRWVSHNIQGKASLNDLVVNVPVENQ